MPRRAALLAALAAAAHGTAAAACAPPAVHAALYLWYGTPEHDGKWMHWDHKSLPHWDPAVDARHPKRVWRPPSEAHAPSADRATVSRQFRELRDAGVSRDDADSGANTDLLLPAVLDAAHDAGVKVSVLVEPYEGRGPGTVLADIRYLHAAYGGHPALWRERCGRPLYWLYDVSASHQRGRSAAWRAGLADPLRGSAEDGVLLSLYLAAMGKRFVPAVGPGYDDTLIRPWNAANRGRAYDDYGADPPDHYLSLTRRLAGEFRDDAARRCKQVEPGEGEGQQRGEL
eukprot:gene37978-32504_t